MVNLFVKINSEEKSYPILIENEEISELKKKIFDYIKNRNFLVVISQKVEKLNSSLCIEIKINKK